MKTFMNLLRKATALIIAVATAVSMATVPSFAATTSTSSASVVSTGNEDSIPKTSTKLMACEQMYVSGGYGELKVHLDSSLWGGYLKLTTSGGAGHIVVNSVIFPSGKKYPLNSTVSNGSSTGYEYYLYLPKGDYTFIMDGVDNFYALGCIYND